MSNIQENLLHLLQSIRTLEQKYHRPPHSVSLIAISKDQPLEKLQQAISAGQRLFGENYLQEALPKMAALPQSDLEWHFTGSIQSNKTRQIAENFAWAHTVDSPKIAQRLNDQRPADLPPLQICLQANVGQEKTKAGLKDPAALQELAAYCSSLPRLQLRGLMTIPKVQKTLTEQRAQLHILAGLQTKLCEQGFSLDTLSMGMTEDLEAAIAEGATFIRIGRGIFGPRSFNRSSP